MTTTSLQLVLLVALCALGCESDDLATVEVRLPSSYAGWVFLIENRSTPPTYTVAIDSAGIGYLPREIFVKRFEVRVIRERDITDLCTQHADGLYGTSENTAETHYGSFYVPYSSLEGGDSLWERDKRESRTGGRLSALVQQGKAKVLE